MTDDEFREFKDSLGWELVEAAHRQQQQQRSLVPRGVLGPITGIAAAGAVMTATVFGTDLFRSGSAAAEVFAIRPAGDRVELTVVDLVADPGAVSRQLSDELGLEATVTAVPVPQALVGQVLAVQSNGSAPVDLVRGPDGAVDSVIVPASGTGPLEISYGRSAGLGEDYLHTVTDPVCADLWGLTPAAVEPQLDVLADGVRYEVVTLDAPGPDLGPGPTLSGSSGQGLGPSSAKIDPAYRLSDIFYLDDSTIAVVFAVDLDAEPRHPNCGS